jgi:hypothetical protein
MKSMAINEMMSAMPLSLRRLRSPTCTTGWFIKIVTVLTCPD